MLFHDLSIAASQFGPATTKSWVCWHRITGYSDLCFDLKFVNMGGIEVDRQRRWSRLRASSALRLSLVTSKEVSAGQLSLKLAHHHVDFVIDASYSCPESSS
jgi:hypothetical protein